MLTLRALVLFLYLVATLAHTDSTQHTEHETKETETETKEQEPNKFDRDNLEAGILYLTDANFNESIASHPAVLVKFFAPWCIHSGALAPEYLKAATILKLSNSKVRLARMDASVEKETAGRFSVTGYPTLKYIKGDAVADYSGGKTGEAIASWVETKLLPATTKLNSIQEAEKFAKSQNATLIGLFKGSQDSAEVAQLSKILEETAFSRLDELPCGVADSEEILAHFGASENTVILFKNIDNERLVYTGPFDVDSIAKFVKKNKLPLVVEFTRANAPDIFGGNVTKHALAFVSKSQKDVFEATLSQLKEPARTFKDRVLFIYVDVDDNEYETILQFFSVKKESVPTFRVIGLDMNMSKFKPTFETITAEAVTEFVKEVIEGRADPHLPSQDQPDDWDKNPVKVLVIKNFDQVTMDQTKTVFVMFYVPWCEHSKELAPVWEQLAIDYAGNDTIVIAKMDSSQNELSDIKIASFPTLKLFPANSNSVFDYYGLDRTLPSLKIFLDSGGKKQPGINDKEEPPAEETPSETSEKSANESDGTNPVEPVEDASVETEDLSEPKEEL